ncbi:MAG: ABC transporter ATP-binding protein [Isosphaerales bacterium]
MTYACRAERLGKRYHISRAAPRGNFGYRTLQEELVRLASAPWRRLLGRAIADPSEDFWALRNADFEIQPGEVVGIVGRNGAGKSTLLKILSRITKPTTGQVELRGRVGSLLEVGTGFHPELTGRENIYLNGAILGMSRREIDRKFDEIVAFAEVERFLDTPVKRYSSGMYVRLAFAVSAYLEPEILIVDEVLAVGDMAFQRKCLGRMKEVGRTGRTVLFVSHNMPAVESLCTRAILLEEGQVVRDGDVTDLIGEYRRRAMALQAEGGAPFRGEGRLLRSATLLDAEGVPTNFIRLGGLLQLRISIEATQPISNPTLGLGIDDANGQRMLTVHTPQSRVAIERVEGRCAVDCRISEFPMAPGDYWVKVALSVGGSEVDSEERALHFSVVDGELFSEGRGFQRGCCVAPSKWEYVGTGGFHLTRTTP